MYIFGVQCLSFPPMRVKFGVELDAVGNPAGRQKMNGDVLAYEQCSMNAYNSCTCTAASASDVLSCQCVSFHIITL